jgi:hypothetical protein
VCGLEDVDNDTIATLWLAIASKLPRRDRGSVRLLCKTLAREVASTVTSIDIQPGSACGSLDQDDLECLAHTFLNLLEIDIHNEYDDNSPGLDFTAVHFPKLKHITLDCCSLVSSICIRLHRSHLIGMTGGFSLHHSL